MKLSTLKNVFIVETDIAAKGDLFVGLANDLSGVIAVGVNDQILIADSATATGIKWGSIPTASGVAPTVPGLILGSDKSKLDGIATGADVTGTVNVTAAGAVMNSQVDLDIKTLVLPANTTISAFGATVVDDADAATARATLGVDYVTLDERSRDTLGTALVAGANVTIVPNDAADTITIAATKQLGTANVNLGYPAVFSKTVSVADARVVTSTVIIPSWGRVLDTDVNSQEMDENCTITARAQTGAIDFIISSTQLLGGVFKVSYLLV